MSYCLNPRCPKPENTNDGRFCLTCGAKLLLKDRYRAMKPIGQGGFGRTFLAVDEDKPSKPHCVIKQFYPQAQGTSTLQKAVELFNQEAMRLDELGEHPQIPDLLAYFTQEDRQYLVQEFIDGYNLAQELAHSGTFGETQIRHLLYDLLPVLQFCHARNVIHRDIKPENIIRRRALPGRSTAISEHNPGNLVLVDFGASKVATNADVNKTGTSIGSPEYVAPEQIRGKALFASDIYSLGVTCINLLTGKSPFDLHDIHNDTWIWRQFLTTPLSNELAAIIDSMLQTIPARRYQLVDEILQDLEQWQPTNKPLTTPVKLPVALITNNQAIKTPASNNQQKSQSQIDTELNEIKTMFLGAGKPVNNPNPTSSTSQTTNNAIPSKSKIDEELEEMRSKFLGNNQ
ncbi:serine/threonine-protein kinase [Calothrix sp. UHCC 0171]|uniref:serine/threonine-protein kinase n=1 Tax=Calothrix sp. UHCC 0171 TaxID=3110245 RepID=UPI002B2088E3|nr:serine/threonine-protein kinase [Calothrix sp. UHCC 0171]MEA5570244.1 serine/threonine-protein kinase [Calothrix sp. UHCC 0171]